MAVFGVPFAAAEDPVNSCNAALRMQESVRTLNDARESAGLIGIKVGIGINTGPVRNSQLMNKNNSLIHPYCRSSREISARPSEWSSVALVTLSTWHLAWKALPKATVLRF